MWTTVVLVGGSCAVLVSAAIIRQPVVAGVVLGLGALAVAVARRRPRIALPMELTAVLGLVAAVAVVAGLSPLIGNVAVLIALADLLAGVPLVVAGTREPRRSPAPTDVALPATTTDDQSARADAANLSTEELCAAWRSSRRALEMGCLSAEHQDRIVTARGRYLDELLRRYPDEMARWLAAGSPDADPADFVNHPPGR